MQDDADMLRAWCWREVPKTSDMEAVKRLVIATGYFREDEVAVAVELVAERLERGVVSGYFFVFAEREDGSLAGYACWGPTPCSKIAADLYWIVVEPMEQGKGLGRMVSAKVEAAAVVEGRKRLYAETSGTERYAPTRRFYERCGYALMARLPDFYDDGDDKIFYGKDLIRS